MKAVFQSDVEAVVGIMYPEANPKARVPFEVIGEPVTVRPVGTVIATEVTVPCGIAGKVAKAPAPVMY
ncbi:hypothetical protein SDC9_131907 [bioreactor metagenome]|uniref:Uncharacterized protein n=1 Tax=bioreactor metagenome TaxID=1076179 RepID=A0A645D6E6_9ZZZZ